MKEMWSGKLLREAAPFPTRFPATLPGAFLCMGWRPMVSSRTQRSRKKRMWRVWIWTTEPISQRNVDDDRPNKITAASASGPPQLPMRTRWATRVAQFCRLCRQHHAQPMIENKKPNGTTMKYLSVKTSISKKAIPFTALFLLLAANRCIGQSWAGTDDFSSGISAANWTVYNKYVGQ